MTKTKTTTTTTDNNNASNTTMASPVHPKGYYEYVLVLVALVVGTSM